jgi:hypothetical protein
MDNYLSKTKKGQNGIAARAKTCTIWEGEC